MFLSKKLVCDKIHYFLFSEKSIDKLEFIGYNTSTER